MPYNREEERLKAHQFVSESLEYENMYSKQERVKRAVAIAEDEIQEFEQAYQKFVDSVKHLHVFAEIIERPMTNHTQYLITASQNTLTAQMSEEEFKKLPPLYQEIIREALQKKVELLRKIAKTYGFASK